MSPFATEAIAECILAARIASGRRSISSFADVLIPSTSPADLVILNDGVDQLGVPERGELRVGIEHVAHGIQIEMPIRSMMPQQKVQEIL
jgi:hypothetical protein